MTPAETPTECAICRALMKEVRPGLRLGKMLDLIDAHHALIAAKDARIRELVGILWQIATDPLQDHHIREAVSAALARSEGGSCRRSSEIRAVAAQSRR